MANPKWLNKHLTTRPEVSQIFDDLDAYREFCVDHGRSFNEADLYNERSRDYSDFLRFKERGYARNNWNHDRDGQKPHHNNNRPRQWNNNRPNHNYRSR